MRPRDLGLMTPQEAAEMAVAAVGCGYDLSSDLRLTSCKAGPSGSRLIELDGTLAHDLVLPGGIVVPGVPRSIKCDKGERIRFRSDVVSFHQVLDIFYRLLLSFSMIVSYVSMFFLKKSCIEFTKYHE